MLLGYINIKPYLLSKVYSDNKLVLGMMRDVNAYVIMILIATGVACKSKKKQKRRHIVLRSSPLQ